LKLSKGRGSGRLPQVAKLPVRQDGQLINVPQHVTTRLVDNSNHSHTGSCDASQYLHYLQGTQARQTGHWLVQNEY
jgi:hypothetical protein